MRVALVSPLPPAATGVADYTVRLIDALRQATAGPPAAEGAGQITFEALDAVSPEHLRRYDGRVYQIGNNRLHETAYRAALEIPGIVVLHDGVLHHLLLALLSEDEYIEEFVHNFGGWYRDVAQQLWRDRGHAMADDRYFRYPLLRRIVEASRAVVVHNRKAAALARDALRRSPRAVDIVEIPHFVENAVLPSEREVAEKRAQLGIPDGATVISCFGYMRPAKRLHSLLEAARKIDVPYRVLIVGEFVSPGYEASMGPLFDDERVIRLPYVPEDEFWRLAGTTDICVNLRYPTVGETSGVAMKLMAAGKPVIVTDGEEYSALPKLAAIRIDSGEAETEMLAHYLYALATDAEMRRCIGSTAAEYVRNNHELSRVARAYADVIRATFDGT